MDTPAMIIFLSSFGTFMGPLQVSLRTGGNEA